MTPVVEVDEQLLITVIYRALISLQYLLTAETTVAAFCSVLQSCPINRSTCTELC